ncbi:MULTISPECIES: hypothetical protein [unclassified Rhizobium]|uniref:hypothetical protein n=1 Tax=unclassified Rhizobium TaxID=2613769 RepID=UPI0007140954|nr:MULTISPECIES: hypothetical protein [unclassified Rhizobium]KQS89689.1 hypothetical protein ASG42_13480 [Rhizobium sp. Leaf391]KQS94969.1 hypothetical protein ASG50_27430 [Rhizobium sp. Leaf386]KQU01345.1 hypothetical protein ASG68_06210 [Rhizobium sp. Leaf453]
MNLLMAHFFENEVSTAKIDENRPDSHPQYRASLKIPKNVPQNSKNRSKPRISGISDKAHPWRNAAMWPN